LGLLEQMVRPDADQTLPQKDYGAVSRKSWFASDGFSRRRLQRGKIGIKPV
jgi:hypothetical protein